MAKPCFQHEVRGSNGRTPRTLSANSNFDNPH